MCEICCLFQKIKGKNKAGSCTRGEINKGYFPNYLPSDLFGLKIKAKSDEYFATSIDICFVQYHYSSAHSRKSKNYTLTELFTERGLMGTQGDSRGLGRGL